MITFRIKFRVSVKSLLLESYWIGNCSWFENKKSVSLFILRKGRKTQYFIGLSFANSLRLLTCGNTALKHIQGLVRKILVFFAHHRLTPKGGGGDTEFYPPGWSARRATCPGGLPSQLLAKRVGQPPGADQQTKSALFFLSRLLIGKLARRAYQPINKRQATPPCCPIYLAGTE